METIYKDDDPVGIIKSTAYGHTIGKSICYGYVKENIWKNKVAMPTHAGNARMGPLLPVATTTKTPFVRSCTSLFIDIY